jgi:hypothetical protein
VTADPASPARRLVTRRRTVLRWLVIALLLRIFVATALLLANSAAQHAAGSGGLGPGWLRRVASDVYHPLRFLATLPATGAGLTLIGVRQLQTGEGACRWNQKYWVVVCYNSFTLPRSDAFAIGATVSTRLDATSFRFANDGRFTAHEVKHTDQWALLGDLGFGAAYGVDTGQAEGRAALFGGQAGSRKLFEQLAGLMDGGYGPARWP